MKKNKIILVSGRWLSGKTFFSKKLEKEGFVIFEMSKPLLDSINGEKTKKNILKIADEKKQNDPLFCAKKIMAKINKKNKKIAIIGVRTIEELNFFKNFFEIYLIFMQTNKKIRFKRMLNRKKPSDPKDIEGFNLTEEYENRWKIDNLKKHSNLLILNNFDADKLTNNYKSLIKEITRRFYG